YTDEFSPALGLQYLAISKGEHTAQFKYSLSRSFKIPTFNDRYWGDQGNPSLRPEIGFNNELGGQYKFNTDKFTLDLYLTGYVMQVDDWIIWLPKGNNWYPENIKEVNSKGVEAILSGSVQFWWDLQMNYALNYAYIKSLTTEAYAMGQVSKINEQLLYTPTHTGNFTLGFKYKKWKANVVSNLVGKRYNENRKKLEAYTLWAASMHKNMSIGKNKFVVGANCYNIFNTTYQNQYLYAMPGRNYAISLKYYITNLKL
ncbi:MAG: TonB-dependent receptor, partial [Bacteroidales bacterium]|nr:TonB-dependent receptor [Bacteroidales bacterium]